MIPIRNRLIFGLIKKIIVGIFKIIYKVLSFLNLQITLLVVLLGGLAFLTGNMETVTAKIRLRNLTILAVLKLK